MSGERDLRSPAEEFLLVEYKETWNHYRHLETMRSGYLSFFFVVTLGAISIGVPFVARGSLSAETRNLVFSAFLLAYAAITSAVLIALVRMGEVLQHLESILEYVRNVYPTGRGAKLVVGMPATGRIPHPVGRRYEFQVQRTAEVLLLAFMLIAVALQLVVFGLSISEVRNWGSSVLIGLLAALTSGIVATVFLLRLSGRTRTK